MTWLENLEHDQTLGKKRLAALLDPDDLPSGREWLRFLDRLQNSTVTDIFIGGSLLIKQNVGDIIQTVRERFDGPITIFPGAPDQVVKGADALLFLSLISGATRTCLLVVMSKRPCEFDAWDLKLYPQATCYLATAH